jgi:hypothetical protein
MVRKDQKESQRPKIREVITYIDSQRKHDITGYEIALNLLTDSDCTAEMARDAFEMCGYDVKLQTSQLGRTFFLVSDFPGQKINAHGLGEKRTRRFVWDRHERDDYDQPR